MSLSPTKSIIELSSAPTFRSNADISTLSRLVNLSFITRTKLRSGIIEVIYNNSSTKYIWISIFSSFVWLSNSILNLS